MRNRLILSGLATTGALEAAVLTYAKYFRTESAIPFCSDALCTSALASKFSSVPLLNIPLVSVGLVGYASVAILSIVSYHTARLAVTSKRVDPEVRLFHDNPLDTYLIAITASMATFSGYLMSVLLFILQTPCVYCITSSALSFTMAAVAWNSSIVHNKTKAFVVASTSVIITLLASGFLFYATTVLGSDVPLVKAEVPAIAESVVTGTEGTKPPFITTDSTPASLQLAERLKQLGAKLYGAYWCSHCHNQKQVLGEKAFYMIEYIECDADGYKAQKDVCRAKKLVGYPTWEIGGQLYPGEKSVAELQRIVDSPNSPQ